MLYVFSLSHSQLGSLSSFKPRRVTNLRSLPARDSPQIPRSCSKSFGENLADLGRLRDLGVGVRRDPLPMGGRAMAACVIVGDSVDRDRLRCPPSGVADPVPDALLPASD